MAVFEIPKVDVSDLEQDCIASGNLIPQPYEYYQKFNIEKLLCFMQKNAFYILPTTELIEYIQGRIIGSAIDIAAGNGSIGRSLGIPITDSMMQSTMEMKWLYRLVGQPTIEYPQDVEQLTAIQAVHKYKPDTVVGSYVTHKWEPGMAEGNALGVDFKILYSKIRRLILVGHKEIHKSNPLLKVKHEEVTLDSLITRSVDQTKNRIFIWTR